MNRISLFKTKNVLSIFLLSTILYMSDCQKVKQDNNVYKNIDSSIYRVNKKTK